MSQHIFHAVDRKRRKVTVTMGYDRPLNYVFCTICSEKGKMLYSNLGDTNAGCTNQDVEYYRPILRRFGIQVPELMFMEVVWDQAMQVGNRVVVHTPDE
ncbi:hypothetical protein [Edaphobacter dinghuensis]|uniref:Uncharacterized protein n=1 Tax=Edaphobacter dinghuensis TaxID=1560005 RepID=A0A917HQ41_9BACT|nr:hypothetical protein [Edaphobacter dinghuensis]GGG87118.1 hypothetical protein GCM10011585_33920 [Edaphobacter dinghuensis]